MNYEKFMTALVEVYGVYNSPILEKLTFKYIKERWRESELDDVFKRLILVKSAKFKTPPDPAELEELFFAKSEKDYEAEALGWWSMITRTGNSLDDVIISDIRAQSAIEDMGGWALFCQRNPENEHFHQAKFIKWFIMYSQHKPEREMQILIGDSVKRKTPLMFGDKEKCRQFLQLTGHNPSQVLKIADQITKEMRV
ncbi:MAG: hypothetical protein CVV49_00485 [Spirochaetae bacterium HGW-Spirochaetae-5]|nr:MAG: hypothetical protein CVV49_00485 [Spirochaetae bacterium HGW-Spirochaetae-5]